MASSAPPYPQQPSGPSTPYQQPPYPAYGATVTPTSQPSAAPQPGFTSPAEEPAIPIADMEKIPGYENAHNAMPAPPAYTPTAELIPKARDEFRMDNAMISKVEAHEALVQEASTHCCWGKSAARDSNVINVIPHHFLHYVLDTWAERRTTKWKSVPYYMGMSLDTAMNGRAPGPWEIMIPPPAPFATSTTHMEVPHTASTRPCTNCFGTGYRNCFSCNGAGHRHCCNNPQCSRCNGRGRERCISCNGSGRSKCSTCMGHGMMKFYIELKIEFLLHMDDFLHEASAAQVPIEKIRMTTGRNVYEEQNVRVAPLQYFPDPGISSSSMQFISKHAAYAATERLLMQRQRVRSIPVAECTYHIGEKPQDYHMFVYGLEHSVHAPDYPQTCCWGCSIL